MKHHNNVEIMFDGNVISSLLITTVSKIMWLPDQRYGQFRNLLISQPNKVSRILAVIVADNYFLNFWEQLLRNSVKDLSERRRGVYMPPLKCQPLFQERHQSCELLSCSA